MERLLVHKKNKDFKKRYLDSDDIYLEGMIGTQVDHFRNHKNYDICYTNSVYFNDKKDILSTHYNFSGDLFYFLKRSNFIHPSAVTMRRRLSDSYLYDEKIPSCEDRDFFLRFVYRQGTAGRASSDI